MSSFGPSTPRPPPVSADELSLSSEHVMWLARISKVLGRMNDQDKQQHFHSSVRSTVNASCYPTYKYCIHFCIHCIHFVECVFYLFFCNGLQLFCTLILTRPLMNVLQYIDELNPGIWKFWSHPGNVWGAIGGDVLLYLPWHCKQEDICLINSRLSQDSAGFDQPVAQNSTAIS